MLHDTKDERKGTHMRHSMLTFAAVAAAMLGGCSHSMQLPEMFVKVEQPGMGPYEFRAVAPDGVVLALRVQKNSQGGSLAYWAEAIRNELTGRGYKLANSESITGDSGRAGQLLSFTADKSGKEFTFLIAAYVQGGEILIAEAGGKTEAMKPRAEPIRKALLSAR